MKRFFYHLIWLLRGVKVFALIGKSGSGKSFRAKLIGQKYGVQLIIDDGLLISEQRILAGRSAKKEKAYLGAIKTALFEDIQHRTEVRKQLEREKFNRILILGTSEKMVKKITQRLNLPPASKIVRIEEIATREEIEQAIRSRKFEGKHVIPVPSIEVKRNYPHLVYESIKVFLKKNFSLKKPEIYEKTVVRPEFSKQGKVTISETALSQMILHCVAEYENSIRIKRIVVKHDYNGYMLDLTIEVPFGLQLSGNIHNLQNYIIENIERYTGITLGKLNITIGNIAEE